MENSLFCTQFSPLNAGNCLLGLAILKFLHATRHPLKMWTVDTVSYFIQISWLLQFLLKPPEKEKMVLSLRKKGT